MGMSVESVKATLDAALAEDPEPLKRRLVIEGIIEDRDDPLAKLLECNGGTLTIIVRAIPSELASLSSTLDTTSVLVDRSQSQDFWPPE